MADMFGALAPMPRNPARMPQAVEDFAYGALLEPAWDVAKGVGALATGQGMVPEVGAGIMGAMGLMSPGARLAKPVTQGIRAFHGSPHKIAPEPGYPLGRFSMDKIGTGEGAQAYGHGLYFAENERVAKSYRDALAGDPYSALNTAITKMKGRVSQDDLPFAQQLLEYRIDYPDDPFRTVARSLREETTTPPKDYKAVVSQLKDIDSELIAQLRNPGHMYEVNINAKPEQFLDWDRPLSGQPEKVQSVLKKGAPTDAADLEFPAGLAYHRMSRVLDSPQATTQKLREAGIPGIKYLDQGSRTQVDDPETVLKNVERAQTQVDRARQSGDADWLSRAQNDLMQWSKDYDLVTGKAKGTKNYVVFDDKLIDILKRYGLAAGAAPFGALAMPPDATAASP